MGSTEVIVLSDEEDLEASVLLVEPEPEIKNNVTIPAGAADQDLVVTFSRCADLLPHARYDCPVQPFTATECEISNPVEKNELICIQCFCYICDKLASQCQMWTTRGVCHCNSHKRSTFWNNLRNCALLGGLRTFNLTLCEIDSHLRHAETLLQKFNAEVSHLFTEYLMGKPAIEYGLTLQGNVHDYTNVFVYVSSFLALAEKQDSRAAAIMHLGAAETFVRHCPPAPGIVVPHMPTANTFEARTLLMNRVISFLQGQIVMDEISSEFSQKLQQFYVKLTFPTPLKGLKSSLCVRPWEDRLLVSVLRGQNVCGFRKDKGKKDILLEQTSVVQLRIKRLQQQGRYRELCRYLRVVQTDDPKSLQNLLDMIPFFLCADGQLSTALQTLITTQSTRLSPQLFLAYLHMFSTATAPMLVLQKHSDLCCTTAWKPIKGAVPLKPVELVKFFLKVQACCPDISNDGQCWSSMLSLASYSAEFVNGLPEPRRDFIHGSKDLVKSILETESKGTFQIPRHFLEEYPDQALLLLLTEALAQRLRKSLFSPLLPVLCCLQKNLWAQRWLWDSVSSCEHLKSFLSELAQGRALCPGGEGFFPSLTYSATNRQTSGLSPCVACTPPAHRPAGRMKNIESMSSSRAGPEVIWRPLEN